MKMRRYVTTFSLLIAAYLSAVKSADYKSKLDDILSSGVSNKVYPAVAAMAATPSFEYSSVFGSYKFLDDVYSDDDIRNDIVKLDAIFDIASVSKVIGGTTAVALLYQRGYLNLDTLVTDILGIDFANGGKENITIRNCLLHNAGFKADPEPWYWEEEFGCPNTNDEFPSEDFSCLEKIYTSFMSEQLAAPVGEVFKYSDLSFITLSLVVGTIVQREALLSSDDLHIICATSQDQSEMASLLCAYEGFVRVNVFEFNFIANERLMPTAQFTLPEVSLSLNIFLPSFFSLSFVIIILISTFI